MKTALAPGLATGFAALALLTGRADAREYYVGGPVHIQDMEIVANYLIGVQMAPMTTMKGPMTMAEGPDVIHIEADVHATADNKHGYSDGAWIGYLTVNYRLEKLGSTWKYNGQLKPMIARDGPHYADNVKMAGPGKYKVTYSFYPPEVNGFGRHIDKATGVPAWWKPFSTAFTFNYPQK